MPRPKKKTPTQPRLEAAILIRLTSEEHERLREAANRAGLGLGPWLRMLGLREAR